MCQCIYKTMPSYQSWANLPPFSAYPTKGGYHTFRHEGSYAQADRMFNAFLDEMQRTRVGFELLSTNVVPYFNGVGIYATYKFDRALTRKELEDRKANNS